MIWLLKFKLTHTELRCLIHVLVHSTWGEERDDQICSIFFRLPQQLHFLNLNVFEDFSDCIAANGDYQKKRPLAFLHERELMS